MSAWTPGPWKVEEGSDLVTGPEDGFSVIGGCGCCGSPWVDPCNDVDTSLANARLIAAAPDLAAALRHLVDRDATYIGGRVHLDFASHGEAIKAISDARAALARATGETK